MAADLVTDPTINHMFIHDLESAFYVVFWLSIRLLANTWTPERRALIMHDLFNPVASLTEGASSKKNWMAQPPLNEKERFEVVGNLTLTGLILSLLPFFQARHVEIVDQPTTHLNFGPRESNLHMDKEVINAYLRDLVDHNEVIATFRRSLDIKVPWPEVEPTTRQDIARIGRAGQDSSKWSKSYYGKDIGEGSSQKQYRTE